ncbi:hypothetical protein L2E82_02033 [Cichorium intybus]|uniref:Uncharacterized protein n=1 Tax=Cichorium intybus TaxID=13427 RepID=A0ACB9H1Q3_CICIN|nr:hypothetical protein L2E82_02033 [Cichorium intybus]
MILGGVIKKNPKHLEPSSSICSTSPITLSPVLLLCHHLYTAPFHSTLSTIGFHRSAYQSTPLSQQSVHATLSTTGIASHHHRFHRSEFRLRISKFRYPFRYSPPSVFTDLKNFIIEYKKLWLRLSSELPGLVVFVTSSTDINLEKYKVYWQDAFRFEYDKAGISRIIVLISTINCCGFDFKKT